MNRTRWLFAASWLLLFWLLAGTVWAPAIQRGLEARALKHLADGGERFARVGLRFDGQTAHLSGTVRKAEDERDLMALLEGGLQSKSGLGGGLNPVRSIASNLEVVPYPSGWVLVGAQGGRAWLAGTAANELEARDVTARVADRWHALGGSVDGVMQVRADLFDESQQAEKTLKAIPTPVMKAGASTQVHIARLGGEWKALDIDLKKEAMEDEAAHSGVTRADWEAQVWPIIERLKLARDSERAKLAEKERLAKLPPPHLFFAVRDSRILIRGEVGTAAVKRAVMTAMVEMYPDWRILDDLRIQPQRRPTADFGPLTTALLPVVHPDKPEGKSLALGIAGQAWQFVDWQVGVDSRPWETLLPKDLPSDLLAEDSRIVIEWLQGGFKGIPVLPAKPQPAFLMLALLPDRVIVLGQIAEEGLRTQVIEAVRKAYGSHVMVVTEDFLVRGGCEASSNVLHTTLSLPALPQPGAGLLAFAKPGEVWRTLTVQPPMMEPGGLAASGLLPPGFAPALAEDAMLRTWDYFRQLFRDGAPANTATSSVR